LGGSELVSQEKGISWNKKFQVLGIFEEKSNKKDKEEYFDIGKWDLSFIRILFLFNFDHFFCMPPNPN
jgi:hypothetical protein